MDAMTHLLTAMVGGSKHVDRLLRFHSALGPDVLVAETLDGVESLSPGAHVEAGFRLELTALSVDAHIDLTELLGQPVLLELLTDASRTQLRPFHAHAATL